MTAFKEYLKVTTFMVAYISVVAVAVRLGWEPPDVGSVRMGRPR